MKKIVLGCAALLLSMGLLAGCNNDDVDDKINNTGPEENEPTDDGNEGTTETGPGPEEGGTPEKTDPVIGTVTEGEYWLGFTMGDVDYYFDGSLSGYYGSVTSDGWNAALVSVTAVTEGGYTLSFTDSKSETQYLYAYVTSDGYVDLGIQTDPFTWQYDTAFETFVVELNDRWNFIGTYGSYVSLSMNDYGYLTGDTETTNAQYPAKLYTPETYVAPTSITLSGNTTVVAYELITLTASIEPEDADPSLVWSWEAKTSDGAVTVYDSGMVLGVTAGTVTVTATSAVDSTVSGSIDITVSEGSAPSAHKLGAVDTTEYCYRWFDGSVSTSSKNLSTTDSWEDAAEVYITKVDDGTENECALSFYVEEELKYISATSSGTSTSISDEPCVWYWNVEHQVFALGTKVNQSGGDRGLAYYQSSADFRAYATTSSNLTQYSWVNAFTEKPVNPEKPYVPDLEVATTLTSGQTYYLGCPKDESDTYLFDGGNYSNNYLTGSTDFSKAVPVTATESRGSWTLTCTIDGVEHTIYTYLSTVNQNTYCEVSTVATTGLETALTGKTGASTFAWDSTYYGVTVELSSTKYFLAQNSNTSYAYEFGMLNYSSYTSNNVWINFYSVVEAGN